MQKICYIISDIDKSVFFEHTVTILKESGFQPGFILINCKDGVLDKTLLSQGFEVYHLSLKKLSGSIPVIWKCRSLLKKMQPDIVHCHLGIANVVGLPASLMAGIRYRVFTQHGGKSIRRPFKEVFLDRMYRFCATQAVAITAQVKNMLVHSGFHPSKVTVINYGFDLQRMVEINPAEVNRIKNQYNPEGKRPVIGVIARWVDWKGIQFIIPAFKKLLNDHPNALLCLFNASDTAGYSKEIKALLAELPAHSYTTVPFEYNVYDLYQLFDVFVHVPVNADCEAFGQVYVESLAAGIPSVFTMSGIAAEFIVPGKDALVVGFEDENGIWQAMQKLVSDPALSAEITGNGRAHVMELFSLQRYKANLLNFYNRLNSQA
jgi:glycosyltransferase involved in cell wall biosynthesis